MVLILFIANLLFLVMVASTPTNEYLLFTPPPIAFNYFLSLITSNHSYAPHTHNPINYHFCTIHTQNAPANKHTGYITGDSVRSDVSRSARPVGPFASAKSRRRSRSLSSVIQSYTKGAPRTQQLMKQRESRSKFRTPINNRIQSISADRMMNPVTPKVEAGKAMAMLRYAKQGETVISLQGSPVVASR